MQLTGTEIKLKDKVARIPYLGVDASNLDKFLK